MLLFSTVLQTRETLTPDAFIRLVLKWNEESQYDENIVRDIHWQGEHNVRYGNSHLWIEFLEDPEQGIIAARHEKIVGDGTVWDSDFILNYKMQKIVIQLDRTYKEECLVINADFSTPHFISLLIEAGYIQDDNGLPVLNTPIRGSEDQALHKEVFPSSGKYQLPIVYISKNDLGEDPLDVNMLASRLKGVAHVLIEDNSTLCCYYPNGTLYISYPSGTAKNRRFIYYSRYGHRDARLEKAVRNVIQYCLVQRIDPLLTWSGLQVTLTTRKVDGLIKGINEAESARQEAEAETNQVYEEFDEELKKTDAEQEKLRMELEEMKERICELRNDNDALLCENQGLRKKYADAEGQPLVYMGDEKEFYDDEIRDILLGILEDARAQMKEGTRRSDILTDILQNNPYQRLAEKRKEHVKNLYKGFSSVTGAIRQGLRELGIEISKGDGKHYKLTMGDDQRYIVTISKTPSDRRAGDNCAAEICKKMF